MRQVLRDRIEDFEDEALDDHPEIEEFRRCCGHGSGYRTPQTPPGCSIKPSLCLAPT
jgi:hypothetical protein